MINTVKDLAALFLSADTSQRFALFGNPADSLYGSAEDMEAPGFDFLFPFKVHVAILRQSIARRFGR